MGLVLVVMLGYCLSAPGSAFSSDAPLARSALRALPTPVQSEFAPDPRWRALAGEEAHARIWYWGWSGFYGAVVLGETVIAATTTNDGARTNAYVNIVSSGVGMLAVLLRPPPAAFGLEAIRAMPEDTELERAAKASALRELFERAVSEERFYRSPLNHVIGLTVNAGLAALLYFGYHLGARALLGLIAGSATWEAQVLTHPTGARDASESLRLETSPRVHFILLGHGVALGGSF